MCIRTAAESLAKTNAETEETIIKILWFPHDHQIRLVEVDEGTVSAEEDRVYPFYFPAVSDLPYVSAIALIRPEEERNLKLPEDWGSWDSGVVLYKRPAA